VDRVERAALHLCAEERQSGEAAAGTTIAANHRNDDE